MKAGTVRFILFPDIHKFQDDIKNSRYEDMRLWDAPAPFCMPIILVFAFWETIKKYIAKEIGGGLKERLAGFAWIETSSCFYRQMILFQIFILVTYQNIFNLLDRTRPNQIWGNLEEDLAPYFSKGNWTEMIFSPLIISSKFRKVKVQSWFQV